MSESLLKLYKGLSGNKQINIKPNDSETFKKVIDDLYNNYWHNNDFKNIDFDDFDNYYFYIWKQDYTEFFEEKFILQYGLSHKKTTGDNVSIFEIRFISDEKYTREKVGNFNLFKRILNKYFKKCNYEVIEND